MAVKTYKYNDKTQLTPHFNVQEMKCKCGKNHDIKLDKDLFDVLELAIKALDAKSCNIYSGYRCAAHDKAVGGSGKGSHVVGQAADCYFKDKNGKKISGDLVCCTLEDIGHKKGLAIRCGGSQVYQGNIHIDVRPRKWYGNEAVSFSKSINNTAAFSDGKTGHYDFLTYCYVPKTYYVNAKGGLNVRDINNKIVNCLKYETKINVYYVKGDMAKIGINKYVSTKYIITEADYIAMKEQEKADAPITVDHLIDEPQNSTVVETPAVELQSANVEETTPVVETVEEVKSVETVEEVKVEEVKPTETVELSEEKVNAIQRIVNKVLNFIKKLFNK